MAKRLEKTTVDYVTIAISPLLIMLLVGSLMFFLVETVMSGSNFTGMLKWTMFWFVIAIVLISRIGIEQGTAYASGYGLALAAAVWLVAARYGASMVGSAVVLGIIWWCANKLVWDCTLIEDTEDASGEGLLQVAGVAPSTDEAATEESKPSQAEVDSPDESGVQDDEPTPWWQRILLQKSERKNKPHSPGLWVVYFSMAALPLFGVGQLFLSSSDEAANGRVFRYLGMYVAAGLALLMTTSFLGLRRYLRQRKLDMPTTMVTKWLGMGVALIVAVLVIAMLIPRPQADYSITALLDKVGPEGLNASDYAMLPFDSGEGEGKAIGDPSEDESQPDSGGSEGKGGQSPGGEGDPQGSGGSKSGESDSSGGKSNPSGSGDGESSSKNSNSKGQNSKNDSSQAGHSTEDGSTAGHDTESTAGHETGDGGSGEESSSENSDSTTDSQSGHETSDGQSGSSQSSSSSAVSQVAGGLAKLIQGLIYLAIAVVFVLMVIRNWAALKQGVNNFLNRLKELWASLFGGKPKAAVEESSTSESDAASGQTRKRFDSFQNPFATGDARDMSPAELIDYTFEAFESWATERGVDRPKELTPLEFANEVGEQELDVAKDASRAALLYTREAYSNHRPPRNYTDTLERLWRAMS